MLFKSFVAVPLLGCALLTSVLAAPLAGGDYYSDLEAREESSQVYRREVVDYHFDLAARELTSTLTHRANGDQLIAREILSRALEEVTEGLVTRDFDDMSWALEARGSKSKDEKKEKKAEKKAKRKAAKAAKKAAEGGGDAGEDAGGDAGAE